MQGKSRLPQPVTAEDNHFQKFMPPKDQEKEECEKLFNEVEKIFAR